MRYQLLAIDLDGTTLHDAGHVPQQNLDAIRLAAAAGYYVVPCTGRTYYELPEELLAAPYIRFVIYSNGAGIYDKEKGLLYSAPIPQATATALFHLLTVYDTMLEIYLGGRPHAPAQCLNPAAYAYYRIEENYWQVMDRTRTPVERFANFFDVPRQVEMFNLFFHRSQEREACMEKLKVFSDQVEVTTSMVSNLELLRTGVNKGTGLLAFCEQMQIDPAQTIAIGDSRNDIAMLGQAGLALAVENACDALKAVADQVICSNNANAVAYAIHNFLMTEDQR